MAAPVSTPLMAVRRSVCLASLAAWLWASLQGGTSADDVTDAAAAAGLRRIVIDGESTPIVFAMAQLRRDGFASARLVLPVAGDIAGLPGPAILNQRALAAGAAILLLRGDGQQDGLALIPGDGPDWPATEIPLASRVTASWTSLRQARADFAQAVVGHAAALTELDVGADARGLRDFVIGEDGLPLPPLPPGISHDRRELLGRARMVAVLAATAIADDGSAVSAVEASSRSAHLRALSGVARRAIAASVSGP